MPYKHVESTFDLNIPLLKNAECVLLDILVDVPVSGQSFAAFLVAAHRADDAWILDILVDIATECPSGHMAAGILTYRYSHLLSGRRVKQGDHTIDSCKLENLLDGHVIILFLYEREKRSSFDMNPES